VVVEEDKMVDLVVEHFLLTNHVPLQVTLLPQTHLKVIMVD
jgi:hypothetical protein